METVAAVPLDVLFDVVFLAMDVEVVFHAVFDGAIGEGERLGKGGGLGGGELVVLRDLVEGFHQG